MTTYNNDKNKFSSNPGQQHGQKSQDQQQGKKNPAHHEHQEKNKSEQKPGGMKR